MFRDPDGAYLAHDLSQLLWAIQGRARLLALRLPAAEAAAAGTIAEHAAAAAAMLAGHASACPQANLMVAAGQAWDQAHDRALAQGLTVSCAWRPPSPAPSVALPELVLRRILGNLFANALDAQAGGGWLACEARVAGDGAVVVTIQDGGPGVPEDLRGTLFEPGASGSGEAGRGLGLAGARALARHWGGDLAVDHASGGATFVLRLPAATEEAPTPDAVEQPAVASPPALRLLVVDDEAAVTEMLAELLAAEGHVATVATSAAAARATFTVGAFEAVLIDLGLPDGPGDALAADLRTLDPALAVVLMTGWGRERDLAGCAAAVVDLTAVKPLDLPQLRQLLVQAHTLAKSRRRARDGEA